MDKLQLMPLPDAGPAYRLSHKSLTPGIGHFSQDIVSSFEIHKCTRPRNSANVRLDRNVGKNEPLPWGKDTTHDA
eukprot:6358-Eustigmatos_ZCMA.PRE.1